MSYPTYTQQPYSQGYNPQQYPTSPQHYPANPAPQYYPANPGPQYYPPQHPQVIYRDAPPQNNSQWNDPNTCWLISLLTLCCGCLISEACCDSNVCCCLIPCALPRFGPRRY